jgi:3-deoxy-manno-octulosonate cytidylyltransferase (CMP-KDO synthetase)
MAISFDRVVNSPFKANTFYKHIGLYAFRPEILKEISQLKPSAKELELKLEQWRWLENNYNIKVKKTPYDTYSVDTKDDLKKIIERFG